MQRSLAAVLACLVVALPVEAMAGSTFRLKQLGGAVRDAYTDVRGAGGLVYYTTRDSGGTHLWRTDGTPAGTSQLAGPFSQIAGMGEFDGELYFCARGSVFYGSDDALMKTDGTVGGTVRVKSNFICYSDPVQVGGVVLFGGSAPGANGLWSSDGTEAGTVLVTSIGPSGDGVVAGSNLFFLRYDATRGTELWRTDGSAAGTIPLLDILPGPASSDIRELTAVGSQVYFRATDPVGGRELWKSDGTVEGTVRVVDLDPGAAGSRPHDLRAFGSQLLFSACLEATGCELWQTDGTEAGTSMVLDLWPGTGSGNPSDVRVVGSSFVFRGDDGVHGREPYASDGTAAGTHMIADLSPGAGSSDPVPLAAIGSEVVWASTDAQAGREPWRTDLSGAAVTRVRDLYAGPAGSFPQTFGTAAGKAVFLASDGVAARGLWATDGTATGTVRLGDVPTSNGASSVSLVRGGATIVGVMHGETTGEELWTTDGTAEGTQVLKDVFPGPGSGVGSFHGAIDDVWYFTGNDDVHGEELWRTDFTESGTQLVADLNPGSAFSSPRGIWNGSFVSDELLFAANTAPTGTELYVTDGTAPGTTLVLDINPGSSSALETYSPGSRCGALTCFTADDGSHGKQIWSSDGTAAGTSRVTALSSLSGWTAALPVSGDAVFFGTSGPDTGLWRTDGTPGGTELVRAFTSASPGLYVRADQLPFLYLSADDGLTGAELWRTDGTLLGTTQVADINPSGSSNPDYFTVLDGVLYFWADDGSSGRELWKSDGTAGGTVRVADIRPGPESSVSFGANLRVVGDALFFSANDGVAGEELWRTDGATGATALFADLNPGPASSRPSLVSEVDGTLAFGATSPDGTYGIWLSLAGCGDGVLGLGERCDDGNLLSGDGCAADCTLESETVSETVGPGGRVTTDPEGNGATSGDPVEVTVVTPTGGMITVSETESPAAAGGGFTMLGVGFHIDAPGGSVESPLQLLFQIDGTAFPAARDERSLRVFRNGVLVESCTGPSGAAIPTPCVAERVRQLDGDVLVRVLTVSGSDWTFAIDLCGDAPQTSCRVARKSNLVIKDAPGGTSDQISWRWSGDETLAAAVGDPTGTTSYAFCVYESVADQPVRALRSVVGPGGTCGRKPCWRSQLPKKATYADASASADGFRNLQLTPGATGKAKVAARLKGTSLATPALPLSSTPSVVAQLVSSSYECWGAEYGGPARNDASAFVAKVP